MKKKKNNDAFIKNIYDKKIFNENTKKLEWLRDRINEKTTMDINTSELLSVMIGREVDNVAESLGIKNPFE